MHKRNSFLTLTYDQAHAPWRGMVSQRHLRLMVKRCRNEWERHFCRAHPGLEAQPFRFFGVGEYGERTRRPHYHLLCFGLDFDDMRYRQKSSGGYAVYESARLSELWPFGLAVLGEVTPETAMYCARYALKKLDASGDQVEPDHFVAKGRRNWRVDPLTGERYRYQPEFCIKSRGLGDAWLARYASDVFGPDGDGCVLSGGVVLPTPDFYLRRLQAWDSDAYEALKVRHRESLEDRLPDTLSARLRVQAEVRAARLGQARREGV